MKHILFMAIIKYTGTHKSLFVGELNEAKNGIDFMHLRRIRYTTDLLY